ncbi:MAG: CPBP family intramembrane metalloprotease [Lachnospiraceae bacterium]|nr:CPBP family intramembrane metalloprotease [Lachnospiraceae bacterium]
MKNTKKAKYSIMIVTIISCIIMAFIEIVIEPSYVIKSAAKAVIFLLLPVISMKLLNMEVFGHSFLLNKKTIMKLLLLGFLIYIVIIVAYFLTRNIFDYPSLVNSLSTDQKVNSGSFIWVALYISFCNSFLEEFMFRFFSFIKLSDYTTRSVTYILSAVLFAVYHIAMIGTAFPLPLLILALIGLSIGGIIFDYVDEKNKNIYNSWIIHMFADFAIMTIWYIHI